VISATHLQILSLVKDKKPLPHKEYQESIPISPKHLIKWEAIFSETPRAVLSPQDQLQQLQHFLILQEYWKKLHR
jgi:hypothetical protein